MVDVCFASNYYTSHNLNTYREMHDRKCYSDPKFPTNSSQPALLLNGIDNEAILPTVNIANSLIDVVYEIESQTTSSMDKFDSFSSRDSSNKNASPTNPDQLSKKRKKSTTSLLSIGSLFKNSYLDKLKTFRKNFSANDVESELLLADFSCAFAKYSPKMLIQGRLFVTNKCLYFYSKIVSFENKLIIPLTGVTGINKEKVAKFIPNALKIFTTTSKYFFTSFNSRDKVFTIINQLWQLNLKKEVLSLEYKKSIICDCYGSFDDENMLDVILYDQDEKQTEVLDLLNGENAGGNMINDKCFNVNRVIPLQTCMSRLDDHVYTNNSNSYTDFNDNDGHITMTMDRKDGEKEWSMSQTQSQADSDLNNNNKRMSIQSKKMNSFSSPTNRTGSINQRQSIPIQSRQQQQRTSINSTGSHGNASHSIIPSMRHNGSVSLQTPQSFCDRHDHPGKFYLDVIFEIHVDRLYSFLFSNSAFFKRFMDFRKTVDMEIGKWTDSVEFKGDKERVLNYTLHLKSKIGPKTSATKERQILRHQSYSGKVFLMDTFIYNTGFPLSDCFHTENRYCLINVSPNKTKLRVSSHLVFDKPVFFGSKSLIETTSKSGIADYFGDLESHIRYELRSSHKPLQHNTNSFDAPMSTPQCESHHLQYHCHNPDRLHSRTSSNSLDKPTRKLKSHINSHSGPISDALPSVFDDDSYLLQNNTLTNKISQNLHSANQNSLSELIWNKVFQKERAWLILIVLSLIICLCFSFFYSRFRQLEEITNHQLLVQKQLHNHIHQSPNRNHQSNVPPPETQEELKQWKMIIDKTVDVLDQMKLLLVKIKTKIDKIPAQKSTQPSSYTPPSTMPTSATIKETFQQFLHKFSAQNDLLLRIISNSSNHTHNPNPVVVN